MVRIVRKVAQYFYPQRQTQVMNEGWPTFWHHQLLNTLYDEGHLTDGVMIEWLKSHTNVIYQPPVGHRAYSGLNPYALGFAMYTDIRRICENPTDEDRDWFPNLAGTPWLPALHHAMRNFKDESFIGQYLVAGDPRCACLPSSTTSTRTICASRRFTIPRATARCARRCRASTIWPRASPTSRSGASTCVATGRSPCATPSNNRPLHDGAQEVLKHVARLWGFGVNLESVDQWGDVSSHWSVAAPEAAPP